MENRKDPNGLIRVLEEDRVGKPPNKPTAILLMNPGIGFGHSTNSLDAGINTTEKLFSKPGALDLHTMCTPHGYRPLPPAQ